MPITWILLCAGMAMMFVPPPLAAQTSPPLPVAHEVFAATPLEEYLRALQLTGVIPEHPWSVRAFSTREIQRLAGGAGEHPWSDRYIFAAAAPGPFALYWIRPRAGVIYNSAVPSGGYGAIWAGRGLTSHVQAGVHLRAGPLSATLAPVAFRAENAGFELAPTGGDGPRAFADPRSPSNIDLPQRFGDRPYQRVDPGQSTVRVDLGGIAAGVSTANQQWGPAAIYPLLIGAEAPGFAHGFLGSVAPVNVGIGRLHGRIVWGRLEQSEFSPIQEGETRRFGTGLVAAFMPRGAPGLELGVTRFFHAAWPESGVTAEMALRPFEGLLKSGFTTSVDERGDNQLVSTFARWAPPTHGVELYGEFAREDHSADERDALLEPDHISAYSLGIARAWRDRAQVRILRAEVVNARVTHLLRVRSQSRFYSHSQVRQGHTERGQPLGSVAAYAGWGIALALEHYDGSGAWTSRWDGMPKSEDLAAVHSLLLGRRLYHKDLEVDVRGGLGIMLGAETRYRVNAQLGLTGTLIVR